MYFIAFAGIFIGLITYNIRPPPAAAPRKKTFRKTKINEDNKKYKEWTESNFKSPNGNTMFFYQGKDDINNPKCDDSIDCNSSLIANRTGPNGNYTSI